MTQPIDNSTVSTHLGRASTYRSTYDSTLLVKELRQNNRTHLGIKNSSEIPFVGYDIWNAYEISCLLSNGTPIVAYAKIVYPCDSEYIVESKSLKLYLNSFNMEKKGSNQISALADMRNTIADDLSNLLGTTVQVQLYDVNSILIQHLSPDLVINGDSKYRTLETMVDTSKLNCNTYTVSPGLLEWSKAFSPCPVVQAYHTSLLKSNCRVTGQPDWGDVYIYCVSDKLIHPASLLQYIISFRNENHFHEEIIETIYVDLNHALNPLQLCVHGLYVRRGGIDINPIRASEQGLIEHAIMNPSLGCIQTLRQ
jgi:7-cyano-7-deazaguanine reductase